MPCEPGGDRAPTRRRSLANSNFKTLLKPSPSPSPSTNPSPYPNTDPNPNPDPNPYPYPNPNPNPNPNPGPDPDPSPNQAATDAAASFSSGLEDDVLRYDDDDDLRPPTKGSTDLKGQVTKRQQKASI